MENQNGIHSILKVTLMDLAIMFFTSGCETTFTNSITEETVSSDPNVASQGFIQIEEEASQLTQALFTAVANGSVNEAEELFAQGADINTIDAYGRTPLHIAVSAGYVDMVQSLIAQGARLDIKDNAGRTPLHYAAGANMQDPPFAEAVQKQLLDMLQVLLDNGADINVKDNSGLIPLRYAIQTRDASMVKLLVDQGSDLYSVDNYGYSSYSWLREQISFWETSKGDSTYAIDLRQRAQESKEIIGLLKDGPRQYFVATNGDDLNPGTKEHPFESVDTAMHHAGPGDIIFIRGGVYYPTKTINLDISGEYTNPVCLYAYSGEQPILDFSRAKDFSLLITGSYWHLKGLTITGGYRGIFIMGSEAHHNILEQITSSAHNYTGFSMRDGTAHNIILNCDSYANFDPQWNGEYPDGFEIRFSNGEGNVLIGDRAWNNADDGFDFTGAAHAVRLEWCYASDNGENIWNYPVFFGDGGAFKCNYSESSVPHFLIYCVAWDNNGAAFLDLTTGGNKGATFYNCTAYRNFLNCYFARRWSGILKNNIGFKAREDREDLLSDLGISQHNSWDSELGVTLTDNDFLSLDDSMMTAPRNPDGSIPQNNFLKLAPTSKAIDAGLDIDMPFVGENPDLGAFEYDPNESPEAYINMLHQYVRDRDIEKINELLDQGEDIDGKDWLGYTPLQWAIYFGYPEVVELLLSREADPDIQSITGRYALEIARAMGYADIENLLVQQGANEDVLLTQELFTAVSNGRIDDVRLLIARGADISATSEFVGHTPLFAALIAGHMEVAELLVEAGADVNVKNTDGRTPLLYAVQNNNIDLVNLLLSAGADTNVIDNDGYPLLYRPVRLGNIDMITLLVEHGAGVDAKLPSGMILMQYVVLQRYSEIVDVFVSYGIDTSTLSMAACVGDLDSIRSLIAQGADINDQDEVGWTPLYWAVSMGQTEAVELLVANGADVTIATNDQNTALHQAAQDGYSDIAQILITNGADVNAEDMRRRTPLVLAQRAGNEEIIELLSEYGAEPGGGGFIRGGVREGMRGGTRGGARGDMRRGGTGVENN